MIPAIEKDLGTLPYVIDSVRKMVKHPIGRFYIVSPATDRMKELCSRKGCTFIDERSLLPITPKSINYRSAAWERSGWLYQQLLKLSGDRLCTAKYYLVIDADTVLIRPHIFRTGDGRNVFYTRSWSQPEYFVTYAKLLGRKPPRPSSFVTHYMLFERSKVAELKRAIEHRHGMSWYKAIIQSINMRKQFGFSEFETYANYCYSDNRSGQKLLPARNISLHMNASQMTEAKLKKLAARYRSISFHKRKGYSRKG
ncbi:DUF6492 family protein [Paenibacillus sp. GCM10023252]|uniref:DUF6492 family protein n=1 Tax=Paenibacillus sp. GCM10023252 TaxID=3252649 RepID=UPI0036205AA6